MGFALVKKSEWIALLILIYVVEMSAQSPTNSVGPTLQELKTFMSERLDNINSDIKLLGDAILFDIKPKVDTIEASLPLIEERSSQGLTAIENAMKEIDFLKEKVELIVTKVESSEDRVTSLQNNTKIVEISTEKTDIALVNEKLYQIEVSVKSIQNNTMTNFATVKESIKIVGLDVESINSQNINKLAILEDIKLGLKDLQTKNFPENAQNLKELQSNVSSGLMMIFDNATISVYIGEEVSLDCGLLGDHESCEWDHDGYTYKLAEVKNGIHSDMCSVPPSNITNNNNQCGIVITQASISHNGSWTCNILSQGTTLSSSKMITIENPVLLFNSTDITLFIGQEATLMCGVLGAYRSCEWVHSRIYKISEVKSGSLLNIKTPTNGTSNQCGITIGSIQGIHEGFWTCKVRTYGRTLKGSKTINIKETELLFDAGSITRYIGQNVTLECNVKGVHRSCQWEHTGNIYKVDEVKAGSVSNMRPVSNRTDEQCSIIISAVDIEHQGDWTCSVDVFQKIITGSKTLNIKTNELIFDGSDISSHTGKGVQLDCGVEGEHSSCNWEHRGHKYEVAAVINGSYSNMKKGVNSNSNQCSITIGYVSAKDNGPWTCNVLTHGQKLTDSKNIIIGCPKGYYLPENAYECIMGCPEGFFMLPAPSLQCMKLFNDSIVSWDDAKKKCEDEGLVMAKPYDALTLRRYIVERYGYKVVGGTWPTAWLGARGDGSHMVWQRDDRRILSLNPLWWSGHPGSGVTRNHCLRLLADEGSLKAQPGQPFYAAPCSNTLHALCELFIE